MRLLQITYIALLSSSLGLFCACEADNFDMITEEELPYEVVEIGDREQYASLNLPNLEQQNFSSGEGVYGGNDAEIFYVLSSKRANCNYDENGTISEFTTSYSDSDPFPRFNIVLELTDLANLEFQLLTTNLALIENINGQDTVFVNGYADFRLWEDAGNLPEINIEHLSEDYIRGSITAEQFERVVPWDESSPYKFEDFISLGIAELDFAILLSPC